MLTPHLRRLLYTLTVTLLAATVTLISAPPGHADTARRIDIPAIDVHAPVKIVKPRGWDVYPPRDLRAVGLFKYRLNCGFAAGPEADCTSMVLAHNYAVFRHLRSLRPGAHVRTVDATGSPHRWVVTRTFSVSIHNDRLYRSFGPSLKRRLTLITCEGKERRRVVIARPVENETASRPTGVTGGRLAAYSRIRPLAD